MSRSLARAIVIIMLAVIGSVALAYGFGDRETSATDTTSVVQIQTVATDDNGDGIVSDDDASWDCHTMGNGKCGTDSIVVEPGAVSDAMNEALADAGYDDATLPVLRSDAVQACVTDMDCTLASNLRDVAAPRFA